MVLSRVSLNKYVGTGFVYICVCAPQDTYMYSDILMSQIFQELSSIIFFSLNVKY